ncbi:2-oxoglutarate dehydrogenase E1 component [Pradoshia sp. D12]|uniref:2-oxoglutarate dehydrogenase E1 component n=1 Tax=Bacillaceae TaxID=186817 RepID=UPI00080AF3A4|nr:MULTISPECIES: 2-oxoglutarate dehydrogenase E1 component [Bacillaceae]OCA83420.1 2-oxoglutarate dehydrogenase E1 component [Bacillus sp. FJAT-27986]QFK71658.1 2-oxoglutarate dehydrogenase E1 component [Pradoshia sp. D12]TPF73453.1 2-oxoglutarate dehydrogenase E1 component [Bacillus sp. D12]
MKLDTPVTNPWLEFQGPNLGYVQEMYEVFLQDPEQVDPDLVRLFEEWGPPRLEETEQTRGNQSKEVSDGQFTAKMMYKVSQAIKLAEDIRINGHLAADIYPLYSKVKKDINLGLGKYDLTTDDLKAMPASLISDVLPANIQNGHEAIEYLKVLYTRTIAFEFDHIHDMEEKKWLTQMVEQTASGFAISAAKKKNLLKRLTEVDGFERFLHKTFVGQKRFSIEGVDSLVPLLDELVSRSVRGGTNSINIGMAHRGRLNVLAHVLGKPYKKIFSEFQHAPDKKLVPSEGSIGVTFGWTGDVKYHLGADRKIKEENTREAVITLANNPSHLEFVNPIVNGYTRAVQDDRSQKGFPVQDSNSSMSIIIHGDAAFPGQGIVAETLNLSRLNGYQTGGTVHIIANNMIGFTTESRDSRSTRYSSDLAKGYEIPIIHVNADDPEAVLAAAYVAILYRQNFKKDFLIDLIGYRRYGHNEMDEPMTTNPAMYKMVHEHPTPREVYAKRLVDEGLVTEEEVARLDQEHFDMLKEYYNQVGEKEDSPLEAADVPKIIESGIPNVDTKVELDVLKQINAELLKRPENFKVFNKLDKILMRRQNALEEGNKVDWALAETLAFATILQDGTPVRLTGQDSERGTFAHRNIVLHDSETGETYSPLHGLEGAKASFAVHNSPLSEAAVIGFEYGYNVQSPDTLVLWEAQYGDFANTAQVLFDQFIAAGRAKWGQKSGLVMLLPHGYEGQGPEHSSARLERYLSLAAENNWTVANLSSAAQYFHILRRQAAILGKEEVRPLVLMTPKSLLRNPTVASTAEELSDGEFKSFIEQPGLGTKKDSVERIVCCTGKMAIDLSQAIEAQENLDWLHIVRIEEIYPFPLKGVQELFASYPNLKEIAWVQEEPKNMGAWNFVEPRLRIAAPEGVKVEYIGRRRRSSPAEGDPTIHKQGQNRIINSALTRE